MNQSVNHYLTDSFNFYSLRAILASLSANFLRINSSFSSVFFYARAYYSARRSGSSVSTISEAACLAIIINWFLSAKSLWIGYGIR